MLARTCLVSVLGALAIAPSAFAVMEHLGAPPPGYARLELSAESAIAPAQFVGTLNPSVIMMNGRRLTLAPLARGEAGAPPGAGQGIWLNGKEKKTSDRLGRFFFELGGTELAVPALEVVLRNKQGKTFKASVAQEHFFLEAPSAPPLVMEEKDFASGKPVFEFSGAIPEGSTLTVDEGAVARNAGGNAVVRVALPIGRSVIVARLESKDHASRIFNIPVVVSETRYATQAAALSLEIPGDNKPGQPWTLPYYGTKLKGVTNAGAKLSIDGAAVEVEGDGRFSREIDSKGPDWETEFSVTPNGGTEKPFTKAMLCPDCKNAGSFFMPPYRKTWDKYLFSPTVHELSFFTEGGSAIGLPAPGSGIGAGIYLQRHFHLDAFANHWFPMAGNGGVAFRVSSTTLIGASLSYVPFPMVFFGGDVAYFAAKMHFDAAVNGLNAGDHFATTILFGFHLGLRFKLTERWELSPRATAMPKFAGANGFYGLMMVDPLAVRYNLY